jgi:hypothetical protein
MDEKEIVIVLEPKRHKYRDKTVDSDKPKSIPRQIHDILLEYEEIPVKYLQHLHGSWIKYSKGNGFLKKVTEHTIVIHDIKEGIAEVSMEEGPFYVKKTDSNYQHLVWLIKDHEKQINEERSKLLEFKKKINDMLSSGKLKIIK